MIASNMVALMLLVVVAGCTTRTTVTESVGDGKDLVTASDESDASKRARLRMELASGYFGRGQMTTALDQVKLALQADPTLGDAYNLRGLIYANLGDEKLAEESFRRALQLNPRDADTMQNFGYYLCQKKRYPEASAMFDQALAVPQYRDPSRTLLTKGVCEAFAGQLAESEATLLRAYQLIEIFRSDKVFDLSDLTKRIDLKYPFCQCQHLGFTQRLAGGLNLTIDI